MTKRRIEKTETALNHKARLIESLRRIIKDYEKATAKKRQAKVLEYQKEKKEGGLKIKL